VSSQEVPPNLLFWRKDKLLKLGCNLWRAEFCDNIEVNSAFECSLRTRWLRTRWLRTRQYHY